MSTGTLDAMHTGEKIIIGGLIVQVLFFGCFLITSVVFHMRMRRVPTSRVMSQQPPWEKHLFVLYATSALILVRSVFRLIEYAQGNDGYLISHEVFLYIFDSVLMWICMAILAWVHPSEIAALLQPGKARAVRKGVQVYDLA